MSKKLLLVNFKFMIAKIISVLCALTIYPIVTAKTYYVAPKGGSDINVGTDIVAPWATWQHAFETARAGDTVYFRGGVWYPTSKAVQGYPITYINPSAGHGNNGTHDNPICFFAYPPDYEAGNFPILDCKYASQNTTGNNGIDIEYASYIKFKGLTVRNVLMLKAGTNNNGIALAECFNGYIHFENMTVHDIGGVGMKARGYDTVYFINCDAYNCCDNLDPSDPGGDGDGFLATSRGNASDTTYYTYFYGCRSWHNTDDGYDIGTTKQVFMSNCWSFANGKWVYKDPVTGYWVLCSSTYPGAVRRGGDSFKFAYGALLADGKRRIQNCISANGSAGFSNNNLLDSYYGPRMQFYNNVSYNDIIGFSDDYCENDCGTDPMHCEFYNNIVYKYSYGYPAKFSACDYRYPTYVSQSHNTFHQGSSTSHFQQVNPAYSVTDDDFVSLDTSQIMYPRKPDGSLPEITFLKLKEGSDLIDMGIDVGLAYYGNAPDLGYAEYSSGAYTSFNQPPAVTISNPIKGQKYTEPANITIEVDATDKDGTISKVEYYNGNIKLSETTTLPYSFTWKEISAGSYSITAVATDNRKATTTSLPVYFVVGTNLTKIEPFYDEDSEILNLYPNPNDGIFTIDLVDTGKCEKSEINIVSITGKSVYRGSILEEQLTKQFDLSNLNSGLYIMILYRNGITVTKKFMKG